MPKQIQVPETANENSEVGRKRKTRKALREAKQALQPAAFNGLTAAQKSETLRVALLVVIDEALHELNTPGAAAQSTGGKK